MTVLKIGTLILYVILVYVAISFPLTLGSQLSIGLLIFLSLSHAVECLLYRKLIVRAPGSNAWHVLNVFLFGVFYMYAMKDMVRATGQELV